MGIWVLQLPDGYNVLQLYWLVQTGYSASKFLLRFITGRSSIDASSCSSPNEHETLGWLEFRRRPAQTYIVGTLWSTYVLWTATSAYFFGTEPTTRFLALFGLATEPRLITTDALDTCLALSLLTIHLTRRLYQSMYISIFSQHRTLDIVSLLNGFAFHIATALSVVAGSPNFAIQNIDLSNLWSSLRWNHALAVVLFFSASKIQSDCLKQLAKMRRNRAGHIVTTGYKLPKGGWFETLQVSSPQFLAEILVHVAIGLSLGLPIGRQSAVTWWLLTGYVTVNHAQLAYDKQLLYRAKFEDTPKDRKALIPYLL